MRPNIYYLKLTNLAIRTGSKIHDHYILMSKDKFFVMTSNPVKNMKSHYISTPNIKGEHKPQYIIEHVHHYEKSKHIITSKTEASEYFDNNKEKLQKIVNLIDKTE